MLIIIGVASLFDVRIMLAAASFLSIFIGITLVAIGMTVAKWKAKIDAFKSKWLGGHFLHKK